MAMPKINNQRFRITIILLLIIIGFYFFYFFILVNQKQERLVQKGYRVLMQISKNMDEKFDNYEGSLPNVINQKKQIETYLKNITGEDLKNLEDYNVSEKQARLLRLQKEKHPEIPIEDLLENHFFQLQNLKINELNGIKVNQSEYILIGSDSFYVAVDDFMESIKYDDFFADILLSVGNKVIYSEAKNKSFYNGSHLDSLLKRQMNHFEIAGKAFKVISLPVEIGDTNYHLLGLIDNEDYAGLANQFSPFAVASVAIVLFVFLLSIPLLKLRLLSKYERMSRGDVYLAGISAIIVTSFVALLLAGVFNSLLLERKQIKNNLGHLSKTIQRNIQSEINEISPIFSKIEEFESNLKLDKSEIDSNQYKIFNEIVVIDDNGFINKYGTSFYPYFGKPALLLQSIENIQLTSRAYFNQLINADEESARFLEPVYSYTTGSVEVANSQKTGKGVNLITSPMHTLLDVVMPKNYSYFIIDKTGKVLFHERERKILRENFLSETNHDVSLLKAINQRSVQSLRLKYNDIPTFCYVTPLSLENYKSQYTLLVTYNLQYLQAKSIFTLVNAGTLMLLFFLSLLVVSTLLKLNKNKNIFLTHKVFSFHFLLPSKRHFHSYLLLVFLHILLIIHMALVLVYVNQFTLYQLVLNLLMIAVLSSFFIYLFLNNIDISRGLFRKGKFYAEMLFLFLIFLIILNISVGNPGSLFYFILLAVGITYRQFLVSKKRVKNHNYQILYRRFYGFVFSWLMIIAFFPALIFYFYVDKDLSYQEIKESSFHYNQKIAEKQALIKRKYKHDEEQLRAKNNNITLYFENDWWDLKKLRHCREEIINPGDTLQSMIYQALDDKVKIKPYFNQLNFQMEKGEMLSRINSSAIAQKLKLIKEPVWLSVLIFVTVIFLIILWSSIVSFSKKVKPFYHDHKSTFNVQDFKNIRKLILYGLSGTDKERLVNKLTEGKPIPEKINFSQMGKEDLEKKLISLKKKPSEKIILQNFDHNHHHESLNQLRLNYLEALVSVDSKIIITTSIGLQKILDDFYNRWLQTNDMQEKHKIRVNMDQLESLLQEYTIKTLSLPDYSKESDPLNQELSSGNYLNSLQEKIISKMKYRFGVNDFKLLSRRQKEELIIEIQDMAHAYYHSLWNQCTSIEKYVLYDAAEDGFVNHKNKLVILNLLKKGLLIFDDGLRIMNKSFQHFILTGISGTEVIQMEEEARKRGRWSRYSLIIAVLVFSLVIFYVLAEQEVVNKFTALITGLVALVPTLFSAARSAVGSTSNQSASN